MGTGSLAGQVGLVTGAGRGIGREIAVGLAAEGMAVGLLGRTRETLTATLKECVRHGARGVAVTADVTRPGAVREAVRSIERDLGPVDLLVNNAGQVDRAEVPLWETDPAQWWQVVETNLRGPYHLLRHVLPGMVQRRRGRVVNLNSGFALRPDGHYTAYATSKGALLRLSDNIADSVGRHGVVVLDISPGTVATEMTAGMPVFRDTRAWGSLPYMVAVTVDAARGRFDGLHGRFLHAGRDNLETLVASAPAIRSTDARTLRLRPYGPDDPLG
ncbi:short-subunit dehydrogenase [Kitasatospora sp. SolWspMP-SS2h]|uniref:SDR family NAD(P)-dependent oxidoreductase n=1 Tax=Kitasatospora sp. SolWspMP-SS2h TaxID=1305729 RepID=UPI000DBAAFE3|nr:SDR family oxidoreductase [Kitasatospora sp. SolWspMP-SS2h]RAJ33128.1 short-subunit dehydrogenase [Kitasatospora sp. SolWspMP-SS2h]